MLQLFEKVLRFLGRRLNRKDHYPNDRSHDARQSDEYARDHNPYLLLVDLFPRVVGCSA